MPFTFHQRFCLFEVNSEASMPRVVWQHFWTCARLVDSITLSSSPSTLKTTKNMPIEITTRVLGRKDSAFKMAPHLLYDVPYVHISQYGYGRLDASTPATGLATSWVASCIAVVFHCPTTGRTALTHSPNFLYMTTFVPIVDWVTGGKGEVSLDGMPAWFEGDAAKPCALETIVLRGFLHATPQAVTYGHDAWMNDFRTHLSAYAPMRYIRLSIVDSPQILLRGAVLVDKTTARITILELSKAIGSRDARISLTNSNIPKAESYSGAQIDHDLFVAHLRLSHIPKQCLPISLQYDVSRYCLPLPLTDEGRQLVRSKREGEPASRQNAIVKAFGPSDDWVINPKSEYDHSTATTLRELVQNLPCECCGKPGLRKCSACKGAWYCGEIHQREDWKSHKGWCKSHPFPK